MKKLFLLFIVLVSAPFLAQPITVNNTTHSVPELVNQVLISSPCVQATNVTYRTGTQFGSSNGIGYFQNTNPNFPMQSGVILSTGNAMNAPGPNTVDLNDGSMNWPGDADLEATLAAAGITMPSVNATVLEFDFLPISTFFSFDFVFASEEYGNYQCQFSDAFAFLLTNQLTGETVNLALVPNTNQPISVVTIRDFLYNSACPSANVEYFGSFNGGSSAAASAINFNGQTVVMNASAQLVPNTPYHIKLVIADRFDNESDSAIFIASESLNIGQNVLGPDRTIAANTAICNGQTFELTTGLDAATHEFSWTRNGNPIAGANGPSITVTQAGTYGVTFFNTVENCVPISDSILIQFFPQLQVPNPKNLYLCDEGSATYTWNLDQNTAVVSAGINGATVSYHATAEDAQANQNPLSLQHEAPAGTTIYARVENALGCFNVKSFNLEVVSAPVGLTADDVTACSRINDTVAGFNMNILRNAILQGQSGVSLSFHLSEDDANNAINAVGAQLVASDNTVVYTRIYNTLAPDCYTVIDFTLYVLISPTVDVLENVIVCEYFVLPQLQNGNYFTGPNGTGTPLMPGDEIWETQTVYIYSETGTTPNCVAKSQFKVTILDPMTLSPESGTFCGSFSLPAPEFGKYFTQPGGMGEEVPPGTLITETQTLYFYLITEVAPFCVIDTDFTITILPLPEFGSLPDVFECESYTLPALSVGQYFTEPEGEGDVIPAGTVLTESGTIYVFAASGTEPNCTASESFNVYIGFVTPADISQCEPYTLPALSSGGYFTGPSGTGTPIPAGTTISTSQEIFVYIQSNSAGCTIDASFNVTVSQPPVDVLPSLHVCTEFILPELTHGNYYTGPNGTGEMLFAGDAVTDDIRVYIFNTNETGCTNESSFRVWPRGLPAIDSRDDIDNCNSYVLTQLTHGNYYTGPGGTGEMLPAGTVITESKTIYIFSVSNLTPYCTNENSFEVLIYPLQADQLDPVATCDSYVLQPLQNGNYYTMSGGHHTAGNQMLAAGHVITASTTLYVYIESGERINCFDEKTFEITINETPWIAPVADVSVCHSYTLPEIAVGSYYTGPNQTGTLLLPGDELTQTQTVYIYSESETNPNCIDQKSFLVTIFNLDPIADVVSCGAYVLPALTAGNYYTGPGGTGQMLQAGQLVTTSRTIYVRAASPFSPVCFDEISFELTVVTPPTAYSVPASVRTTCDNDGVNDGITAFDLSALTTYVLGSQSGDEFVVTYHESAAHAAAGTAAVTQSTAATVYVRVANTLASDCYAVRTLSLIVHKLPEPTAQDGVICYDTRTQTLISPYTMYSGLSSSAHTFKWYNESDELVSTAANYTATTPGIYTLEVRNNATGCVGVQFVEVIPSEPAIVTYTMSDNFSDNMTVTVHAQGTGDYEYQLDFGPFQDSNVFQYVNSGLHTITVRDKNGCGVATTSALVVNYPHFFTPNGDGINDTWNIVDLASQPDALISIFDRYGKLLTQIRPNGPGWNGMLNGYALPSTDYWFVVNYTENGAPREFRAHFAMKR